MSMNCRDNCIVYCMFNIMPSADCVLQVFNANVLPYNARALGNTHSLGAVLRILCVGTMLANQPNTIYTNKLLTHYGFTRVHLRFIVLGWFALRFSERKPPLPTLCRASPRYANATRVADIAWAMSC